MDVSNPITVQKLNNLSQRVEHILNRYPNTRNSDLELQSTLCESFCPPFERAIYNWRDYVTVMRSLPTLDQIARARRKVIQRSGYKKYLPTIKEVAINRGYAESIWYEYAKQENIALPSQLNGGSNIPAEYQRLDEKDEL